MGENKEEGDSLFSVVPADRRRSNGHTLKHIQLYLNIRNSFFADQTWERVVQKACGVSLNISKEIFKPQLDTATQPGLANGTR